MSFLAKLKIDQKELTIMDFSFDINRTVDRSNKPIGLPLGGIIELMLESDRSTDFLNWIINDKETKEGIITFYRRDAMSKMKELRFKKAYCIGYKEHFNSTTTTPMYMRLKISAKELYFGDAKLSKDWVNP